MPDPEHKLTLKRLHTTYLASWAGLTTQGETKGSALRSLAVKVILADQHYLDLPMPPTLRAAFKTVAEDYADAYTAKAAEYHAKVERVMAQGKAKRAAPC